MGTIPPLNSIVKSTNKKIGLRYGISFLDKGYAQSEEKKTEIGTHMITRKTLFSKPKKGFLSKKQLYMLLDQRTLEIEKGPLVRRALQSLNSEKDNRLMDKA